jgi:hypothetical protein
MVGLQVIDLVPGQFIAGRFKSSNELKMNPSTFYKYLKTLEKLQMIKLNSNNKMTIISVENWDKYQTEENKSCQQNNNNIATAYQQRVTTKNNKNNKNIYNEQAEQVYSLYPNKKGKAIAMKKIPDLIKQYGYEKIESCVKRYAAEVAGKDQKYIKHASTFFTSGYMDYLEEEKPKQKEKSNIDPLTGEVLDYWKYC